MGPVIAALRLRAGAGEARAGAARVTLAAVRERVNPLTAATGAGARVRTGMLPLARARILHCYSLPPGAGSTRPVLGAVI